MSTQFDLFAPEPPLASVPGLALAGPLVTDAEAERLCRRIDGSGLAPFRFQQWTGRRLTSSYGWHYDFAGGGVVRAKPMPDWLMALRQRVVQGMGDEPDAYEQALLIRYDPGAGIGWHRDRPQFGRVIGLSLGAPATMRLRRRREGGFARAVFPLTAGHAYTLDGEARRDWEHSIAPLEQRRWSVTFRTLA